MFDPIETSLDAYAPFVDEDLDTNQSIDEMFLMDPECMLHITPAKAQKLWTERVPLLYEGALDNNFTSILLIYYSRFSYFSRGLSGPWIFDA